jgi:glyoxylase-like metal-dependent hydrolase (beta-lactamase superfamily II)
VAVTKVHHLNLCTMCPLGGSLFADRMVAHALLVESSAGVVLVDTGMGLDDVRAPRARLGTGMVAFVRPQLGEEDTAARQIERLGFSRDDVRDIVVTHLDADHAGGLPDFAKARVHVHRREHEAAIARATMKERERYRLPQIAHGPRWELHDAGGDRWFGFESVRVVSDDVVLVPLPGHTRGHCAVAVRTPAGSDVDWLLHAGDAYFHHGELTDPEASPVGLRLFQRVIAMDDGLRRANAARLRELHASPDGKRVSIFSAHCPTELDRFTSS